MDIGRTPIISKAASPSWCGSDVETNSEGQGIKALASAVFIGLFRFALGILPFRKLPLALFAVIVFPYLRDKKTSKSFYDSLRQFDLTGFSSDFRLFFRQRHFPFPKRRTRPAGGRNRERVSCSSRRGRLSVHAENGADQFVFQTAFMYSSRQAWGQPLSS